MASVDPQPKVGKATTDWKPGQKILLVNKEPQDLVYYRANTPKARLPGEGQFVLRRGSAMR